MRRLFAFETGYCQAALVTLPERRQLEQTFTERTLFSILARTLCRLGRKRRLVVLWAWLTLLPLIGPLPQISQRLAMLNLLEKVAHFRGT